MGNSRSDYISKAFKDEKLQIFLEIAVMSIIIITALPSFMKEQD